MLILNKECTPLLIPYRVGNLWGFCNKNLEIIIPLEYEFVLPFVNELAQVFKNGKRFIVNKSGIKVFAHIYDYNNDEYSKCEFSDCHFGLIRFWDEEKYGFINTSGEIIFDLVFSYPFNNYQSGTTIISINGKRTLLDLENKIILETENNFLPNFKEDVGISIIDDAIFVVDRNNKKTCILKLENTEDNCDEYIGCTDFNDGYSLLEIKNNHHSSSGFYFIDKEGNMPIRGYKRVSPFYEGLAVVGEEVSHEVEIKYDGIIGIEHHTTYYKWGFMNKDFKPIYWSKELILEDYCGNINDLEPYFNGRSSLGVFSEGLAKFKSNNKWGFLNRTFTTEIEAKYENVKDFKNGLAFVYSSNGNGYIDKLGNQFWK